MQKLIITFLLCFLVTQVFGQTEDKFSAYLQGQFNKTIYDRTPGNNPWSLGLGLQGLWNNTSKFKPTVDLSVDTYLQDDKVLRLNPDDTPIDDVDLMVNLFAGASYHPTEKVFVTFVTGPSFINREALLGIKPSFGFYFSHKQRWAAKISYINIFNRDNSTNDDFGSVSLAIGVRLF